MKDRKLSLWDIVRIRTALFVGKVCWLNRAEAQALWKGYYFDGEAQGRKENWLTKQLGDIKTDWVVGWKIYLRWVSLVETGGEAKDAFFSGSRRNEVSNAYENAAVAKWLTFLTDNSNGVQRGDLWDLALSWTSKNGEARTMVNRRRKEVARYLIAISNDLTELGAAYSYAQTGFDDLAYYDWHREVYLLYMARRLAIEAAA